MKRTIKHNLLLAVIAVGAVIMTGCKKKTTETKTDTATTEEKAAATDGKTTNEGQSTAADANESTYFTAIDRYLVEEIGKHYEKADHCVPFHSIVGVDESNAEDILVWGDFWLFNYNQSGDTLKTASGGNHPGLMHLRQTESGYEVTAFDQVADGADNIPSAKKIFGDKFDAFQAVQSDDQKREELRAEVLSKYVKEHKLDVTMYQDYGWPAKALP